MNEGKRRARGKQEADRETVVMFNERAKLIDELYKLKEAFELVGHGLDNLIGNVHERIVELEERVKQLEDTNELRERRRRLSANK
jgi:archaellum component FlaC